MTDKQKRLEALNRENAQLTHAEVRMHLMERTVIAENDLQEVAAELAEKTEEGRVLQAALDRALGLHAMQATVIRNYHMMQCLIYDLIQSPADDEAKLLLIEEQCEPAVVTREVPQ